MRSAPPRSDTRAPHSSVLLGGAVSAFAGTTDNTFLTHYSTMSSIQQNWGLGSLGRQDTNKTVANLFGFQANLTGYQNVDVAAADQPQLNLTGVAAGVASPERWVPVTLPNTSAVGAGGGPVFTAGLTSNVTLANFAPMNLTAMGLADPARASMAAASASGASSMGSATASGSGIAAAASSSSTSGATRGVAVGGGVVALLLLATGAVSTL